MPGKKKIVSPEVNFATLMLRLKQSGLSKDKINTIQQDSDIVQLKDIGSRIKEVLGIYESIKKRPDNMIYFIMYDIEHNKIRNYIAKYLERKGCSRIQKSIFIANTDRKLYNEIHNTLKAVQEMYENNDSIFFVPASTDEIKAMKIIGKSIDFDFITGSKTTLFI